MVTLPQRIHLDAANILMITKIGSKITKCQKCTIIEIKEEIPNIVILLGFFNKTLGLFNVVLIF